MVRARGKVVGQPSGCDLWTETPASTRDEEGQDCYWAYESSYTDEGGGFHELGGVWNKWMVTKIVEKDLVAGSPGLVTSYQYAGLPAWTLPTLDTAVGGFFGDSWTRFVPDPPPDTPPDTPPGSSTSPGRTASIPAGRSYIGLWLPGTEPRTVPHADPPPRL